MALQLLLALAGSALGQARAYVEQVLGELVSNAITLRVLRQASALDIAHFEDSEFYDRLQRAQREAGFRPLQLLSQAAGMAQSAIALASALALLAGLGSWVAAVLLVASVPALYVQARLTRSVYALATKQTDPNRRLAYLGQLLTDLRSIYEVKLFNLGDHLLGRHQALFRTLFSQRKALARRRSAGKLGLSGLSSVAFYAFTFYVVGQALRATITIGELTMFSGAFQQAQSALGRLMSGIGAVHEQALFVSDLFRFLSLQPLVEDNPRGRLLPPFLRTGLEFRDVSFTYPGSDRSALQHVSFRVRPGETIALVGPNGAGKTTLVKLLCRFYDPGEGAILIDGVDLRDCRLDSLRAGISTAFQDCARYQMSARENIGLGRVEALDDLDEVSSAAARSGAAPVIEELPEGYNAVLGRLFEGSTELSVGEWQKVGLARAFMRRSPILVLDEPSSSLDARAEDCLLSQMRQGSGSRITILVSHRLSALIDVDRILVLSDGRVEESGSHEELIAMSGTYAELFCLQARLYRKEHSLLAHPESLSPPPGNGQV